MDCSFGVDVAKALIGTFVGAGLAFASGWLLWRAQRRSDHRAAFNAAAQVLALQSNDFATFTKSLASLRQIQAALIREGTRMPDWFIPQPITMRFNETLRFDWNAIGFVFDSAEGKDVVASLAQCELLHFDLANVVSRHDAVALELQRIVAAAYPDRNRPPTIEEIETAVGPALWQQLKTLSNALLERAQKNGAAFQSAIASVSAYASHRLGTTLSFAGAPASP